MLGVAGCTRQPEGPRSHGSRLALGGTAALMQVRWAPMCQKRLQKRTETGTVGATAIEMAGLPLGAMGLVLLPVRSSRNSLERLHTRCWAVRELVLCLLARRHGQE
jgi:hypothetical protein